MPVRVLTFINGYEGLRIVIRGSNSLSFLKTVWVAFKLKKLQMNSDIKAFIRGYINWDVIQDKTLWKKSPFKYRNCIRHQENSIILTKRCKVISEISIFKFPLPYWKKRVSFLRAAVHYVRRNPLFETVNTYRDGTRTKFQQFILSNSITYFRCLFIKHWEDLKKKKCMKRFFGRYFFPNKYNSVDFTYSLSIVLNSWPFYWMLYKRYI